jgi:hypothetical protein
LGAAPSSNAPGAGRSGAEARGTQEHKKKGRTEDARIKGGPSQYPEEAAALAFFRVPRIIWAQGARAGDPLFLMS